MNSKTKHPTISAIVFDDGTIWKVGPDCSDIGTDFICPDKYSRHGLRYIAWNGDDICDVMYAHDVKQIKYSNGDIL